MFLPSLKLSKDMIICLLCLLETRLSMMLNLLQSVRGMLRQSFET